MAVHSSPIPRSHSPAPLNLSSTSDESISPSSSSTSTPRFNTEVLRGILDEKTRFVPFTIDHDNLEHSSLKLLKLVFPEWFPHPSDYKHLKLSQCTDGITNKLMKCKNLANGQVVLIRAYGKKSELMIDRQAELLTFAMLQEDGLAPPLYCRFENGFIYGYLPGIPLKSSQLSDPKFLTLIAKKLAQWHQVDGIPGSRTPRLFKTFWKWFKNIPKSYNRPEVQLKFQEGIDVDFLESAMKSLEIRVKSSNSPVVFCHNDLLAANIIYNPESENVSFIDYEYGSFNYRSFDIANHFCEFAGFDCDYSFYPDEDVQRRWIKEYLKNCPSEDSSDENVNIVLEEIERIFTPLALAFWCLWALVQAEVSDIHFDYMSYAILRFNEFKKRII